MPARCTALIWTKMSLPPVSGWMKPKPLVGLNHLTVPVAIVVSVLRYRMAAQKLCGPWQQSEVRKGACQSAERRLRRVRLPDQRIVVNALWGGRRQKTTGNGPPAPWRKRGGYACL